MKHIKSFGFTVLHKNDVKYVKTEGNIFQQITNNTDFQQTVSLIQIDSALYTTENGKPHTLFYVDRNVNAISIPKGVVTIGKYAFNGSKVSSVVMPNTLRTIEYGAFSNCEFLKELEIPEGVTHIGKFVLGLGHLDKLTLPSTLKSVQDSAFIDVDKIIFNATVEQMDSVEGITNLPLWCAEVQNAREYYCNLGVDITAKSVTILEGVEHIYYGVFNNSDIEQITLPSTLKTIYPSAFANCKNLKEILLPKGLVEIGDDAFGRSGINSIVLPATLKNLHPYAFCGCKSLVKVVVNDSIDIINGGTFAGCEALEKIAIPEGVTALGNACFDNSAISEIHLPNTLQKIGVGAFSQCFALQELFIPEGVTEIGELAFSHSNIRKITLPSTLSSLPITVFLECVCLEQICFNGSLKEWQQISNFVPRQLKCLK